MIKNQNYSVSLPVGQVFRLGLGAEWQASSKLNVAFSYELAYGAICRSPRTGAPGGQRRQAVSRHLYELLSSELYLGIGRKGISSQIGWLGAGVRQE